MKEGINPAKTEESEQSFVRDGGKTPAEIESVRRAYASAGPKGVELGKVEFEIERLYREGDLRAGGPDIEKINELRLEANQLRAALGWGIPGR